MTIEDTAEEAALRAEVAEWMAEHAAKFGPALNRPQIGDSDEYAAKCRAWQAELAEGGWSVVTWPEQYGGRGFTADQARIVFEEQLRYAVPVGMLKVAVDMVGPTIMAHGTDEQKATLIDPVRTGEHLWCQLFSEPDAGSDLSSLRTSARLEGDEWVVNGQKVWTSGGTHADMGMLLARTDPDSYRHEGISYFLIDMKTPGIDVRPLVQINRAAHFNEVFLSDVRIPKSALIGEVGQGWTVARTTLSAERAMIGSMSVVDQVMNLVELGRKAGLTEDPVLRQRLAAAYTHAAIVGFTGDRIQAAVRSGGQVGPEGSILKLAISHMVEELGELAMAVAGNDGMLTGAADGERYGLLQETFLGQWSSRIGGGTDQMQRNMIGERVLGLPRDQRPAAPPRPAPPTLAATAAAS